ncbi:hypothetical protein GCM10009775_35020 [Microbacterium aoyamense]|uniref:Uncharacterized protein n=1 Tax=Microbacterium aoyamense TaxID=344166 RepID=A0ABN2Q0L8_9MICO|nr:hypothetical protein [Microbacterium aoyamense]
MTIDSQLASNLLLGVIGLMSLVGFVAVIGAFWSMGRSGYRND